MKDQRSKIIRTEDVWFALSDDNGNMANVMFSDEVDDLVSGK